MPSETPPPPKDVQDIVKQLPDAAKTGLESFDIKSGEGYAEKVVDAIEMIGEEKAGGLDAPVHSDVTAGMRYLHCSRTIHQLVTDRNRAVGIYLAVASLLLTASGAILHANPPGELIIPITEIQRWCLPVTFATLTILALFTAILLIRTRVGMIYEAAKMNALLGLPIGRVQRNSPLSIHFILQTMVSVAGGASAAMYLIFMMRLQSPDAVGRAVWIGSFVGVALAVGLLIVFVVVVNHITADEKLQKRV